MFKILHCLKAIPVIGALVFIVAWLALIVGVIMNLWKAGVGVIGLLTASDITTDMLVHVAIRVISLFIPFINGIAGYF